MAAATVTAITAWRTFRVGDDGELLPPYVARYWPDTLTPWKVGPNLARCVTGDGHVAPTADCTCGIRGTEDLTELLACLERRFEGSDVSILDECGVLAEVELDGKLLPGVDIPADDPPGTWRASHARLLAVHLGPGMAGHAETIEARHRVPVRVYDEEVWPASVEPLTVVRATSTGDDPSKIVVGASLPTPAAPTPAPTTVADLVDQFGGWARDVEVDRRLTQVGDETDTTAVCEWFEPPHPLALPPEVCQELIAATARADCDFRLNGEQWWLGVDKLGRDLVDLLQIRMAMANTMWWRLDINRLEFSVKRYTAGVAHPVHTDWWPGVSAGRKFVAGAQLSAGEEYEGGELLIWFAGEELVVPRTAGTFYALPGWVAHEVLPVTAGERWSLVANGWGPLLR